jgi:hypothetical protein
MIENKPINLRTPIEENTVIQLNEQRASFVPEAVPFILSDAERALADETDHLPNPTEYLVSISPAFKNNPVLSDNGQSSNIPDKLKNFRLRSRPKAGVSKITGQHPAG